MSANLLDGVTPALLNGTTESDGVWHNAGRTSTDGHKDWLVWDLAGQSALATNQTYHVGLSTRGASANSTSLRTAIGYRDAAGKVNWANSDPLPIGTSWGRAEATIVVPSGMTPFGFYVAAHGTCPETWMASPTLSYGSPVTLASSAHTPYATQDHVSVTYATKASLKVTDDSVKAEVTERSKLAGRVGTLESTSSTHTSKLEQLATSIKSLVKGESTYTDPDGASATSGIYSLVTQTQDSVTALFGDYTKTEDLASTEAVKDAKKAGTDAQAAASAAQTTADSAKSTAQDAKKTADGISVGGRNIARGTATLTNDVQAGEHPRGFGTCDYLGGIKSMGVSTAWSGVYFRLKDMADAGRIKAGQQYTASVYVMSETDLTTTFQYFRFTSSSNKPTVDELTGSSYEVVDLKAGEWHQLKCTFTATSGDYSTLTSNRARIENIRNVEVWYAGPKLDSGNRATDYSPAPEDVDAGIVKAQDTANAANDTANSAKSTADAAKTSAASAVSTANSASSTAGAAKSTADSLATMVRQYSGGVLVCKTGQKVGALVNADGSFDVVDVTWDGETPTIDRSDPSTEPTRASLDADSVSFIRGAASISAYADIGGHEGMATESGIDISLYGGVDNQMPVMRMTGGNIAGTGSASRNSIVLVPGSTEVDGSMTSGLVEAKGEFVVNGGPASIASGARTFSVQAGDTASAYIDDTRWANLSTDALTIDQEHVYAQYFGDYYIDLAPTVLFTGSYDYTNGHSVTLSEPASNFYLMCIIARGAYGVYGSQTVFDPDGKKVAFDIANVNGTHREHHTKVFWIQGQTIDTFNDNGYWEGKLVVDGGAVSQVSESCVGIECVIGWRKGGQR